MSRLQIAVLALAALCCLAGCGPTVTVTNNTRIAVRVIVSSNGQSETVSPSPGESSLAEVTAGAYRVTAIVDQEWIDYARLVRKDLNEQLANADRLSGPQLLSVIQRLKDIAARMQQFDKAGVGAGCGGAVTEDSNGTATVSVGTDGKLVVSCK